VLILNVLTNSVLNLSFSIFFVSIIGKLLKAIVFKGCSIVISNSALNAGSSKHGKAVLANNGSN
jgi:hypothetical protein